MAKTLDEAVREICLSFPESEEFLSHGSPNFRIRGKTFATYVVNHHGDGRVALWLNSPAGAQEHHVQSEPKQFFVPPYVGPRGWLGVNLDKGLSWKRLATLVRQAYEKLAPPPLLKSTRRTGPLAESRLRRFQQTSLRRSAAKNVVFAGCTAANVMAQVLTGPGIEIEPPRRMTAAELDPLSSPLGKQVLSRMRRLCLAWPETAEDRQFGSPVWRVAKKTFAMIHGTRAAASPIQANMRLELYFWVGVAAQNLMTQDERFRIPPYMGHNGWIALEVTSRCDWTEVGSLALASYRHYASQRIQRQLDQQNPALIAAPRPRKSSLARKRSRSKSHLR